MKRILETYFTKISFGILLTLSARADLLVMHLNMVVRHDERTGAVLSSERPPFMLNVETTFAGTFGPDGNIYIVGNSMGAGSILRFNGQTGLFSDVFTDEDATELDNPLAMAFGHDGDLYVCSPVMGGTSGAVFRFDGKTGVEKPPFIPRGEGGVTNASVIRFGPDGDAYILESEHGVVRFRGDTGERVGLIVPGQASHFAFGPDGRIYVLNTDIKRYDAITGADLGTFATAASGELDMPGKIAFGPDGDLFVGEATTLKIKRFDGLTGAYKGVFTISPKAPYSDRDLCDLAFTPQRLTISGSPNGPQIKWPNTFGHFKLEKRDSLDASGQWSVVEDAPTQAGANFTLTLPTSSAQTYFRLTKQN
jgi:hypothetical protein